MVMFVVVVVEELIIKELMCSVNQKLTLGRNMRTTPAIMKITSKAQSIPGEEGRVRRKAMMVLFMIMKTK